LALRIVTRQLRKEKNLRPFIVLVTDGRATSPDENSFELALREARRVRERKIDVLCIDAESGRLRFRQAAALAAEMSAAYRHISTLHPKLWGGVVREWMKFSERRTS
jgi:Mg-chelatase subunit ChlD